MLIDISQSQKINVIYKKTAYLIIKQHIHLAYNMTSHHDNRYAKIRCENILFSIQPPPSIVWKCNFAVKAIMMVKFIAPLVKKRVFKVILFMWSLWLQSMFFPERKIILWDTQLCSKSVEPKSFINNFKQTFHEKDIF